MKLKILTTILVGTLIVGVVAQKRIAQKQNKAIQEVLQDFPTIALEIEELRKSKDPEAREELEEYHEEIMEMLEFKIEEPVEYERESKLSKLEAKSLELAEQLTQTRHASKQTKDELKQELIETLKKEFELRLEGQKLEIDEIENELSDLIFELKAEEEDREASIQDRFEDVTEGSVEW